MAARQDVLFTYGRPGLAAVVYPAMVPRQDILLGYGRPGLGAIVQQHLQSGLMQQALRSRNWHALGRGRSDAEWRGY